MARHPNKPASASRGAHRSGCPVSISLETIGDRWSLLIIRDLMVRGYRTYGEFLRSGEGIATNILAGRLRGLIATGIVETEPAPCDARSIHYRLTEKGIDLAPVVLDLLLWASRHERTGAPCEVITQMARNREEVLAETYRRWRDRDPTPLLPTFGTADVSTSWRRRNGAESTSPPDQAHHTTKGEHCR